MSSYKPKSLEELNSMYDKALSAQRAIKRGTSKINETNSSESFFDDVIKEAELTVEKEPEKRIADLSVAVDDFIKHFSDADKEKTASSVSQNQPNLLLFSLHELPAWLSARPFGRFFQQAPLFLPYVKE